MATANLTRLPSGADNSVDDPARRMPLILGDTTYADVTEKVCGVVEEPRVNQAWLVAFLTAASMTGVRFALIV